MRYLSVFTFFSLLLHGALAQDDESAALKSVEAWLAKPRVERGALADGELAKAEVAKVKDLLWKDHVAMITETRGKEITDEKLKVGDWEMPFLVRVFGEKPEGGRSLYISMHGGGGAPKRVNDQQWQNQIKLYQPAEGIYLAPRAPTDSWNMWHQEHIDDFFDRLIESMVVLAGVNPDKVYLMGYSAGGDGVYQLAPRMADRFAAAAMMAGHPNGASQLGLRNLPITLHVGGKDKAFKRNEIVPQWDKKFKELQADDPGGYIHETKVHEDKSHWMNLEDKVAVPWMAKFTRKNLPERVVWKQSGVTHERFYWLGIPKDAVKKGQLAIVKRDGQTIHIEKVEDVSKLTIYLNDEMLDMDQPVVIKAGDEILFEGKVKRRATAIYQTLAERGDPSLIFSGAVTVKLPAKS